MITKESTHLHRSWPWWRWILTCLIVTALVLSITLSWHYLKGAPLVGCGGGGSCDDVLNSRWSMLGGVLPVSGLAVGVYFAILIASLFIGPTTEGPIRRLAWNAMLVLVGSIAGSAIWFIIIQKWVIGEFCLYCMTTHITGLLLSALIIWRARVTFNNNSNDSHPKVKNISSTTTKRIIRPVIRPVLIGLALAILLPIFQIGFGPSVAYTNGESQNNLSVIDYHTVPIVGSPDAPFVVSLLFDYDCPHCQKIHFMLNEVIRQYQGNLAFALFPTPLNMECNPYIPRDVDGFKNSCELARIGLAVWLAKHEAFPAFDDWMFTFESGNSWHPRSIETAKAKAIELVGKEKFDVALSDAWIGEYLQTSTRIYGKTLQTGNGGVPKLMFGSNWVIPQPNNADDLVMILQKSLYLPMP